MDALVKGIAGGGTILAVGLVDTAAAARAAVLHDAYPTAAAALGRVVSGALLLSAFLKDGQKVAVQVAGDGPLGGVVAEADSTGRVRGYVKRPHIHLGTRGGKLDVGRAVGRGFLNVVKDLGLREYYRGTVPLKTGEIGMDLAYYLSASEQMPSAVSVGVFVGTDNAVKASGGFLLHPLPGADDDAVRELETRLSALRPVSAMILEGKSPQEILAEATGGPVDVREWRQVVFSCPCTKERAQGAIAALGRAGIEELARKGEPVRVECQFCRTAYVVPWEELHDLLDAAPEDDGPEGEE